METARWRFDMPHVGDRMELYLLGDMHIGTLACDVPLLKDFIAHIRKRPNARVLLMGDAIDAIGPFDKRLDIETLDYDTRSGKPVIDFQVDAACAILKPIAPIILGVLTGNHEEKVRTQSGSDPTYQICKELKIKYLKWHVLAALDFTIGNSVHRVVLDAAHGRFAGRKAGGAMNRIYDIAGYFPTADIVARGHSHHLFCDYEPTLVLGKILDIEERKVWGCNTGSFFRAYQQGVTSYAEQWDCSPSALGCVRFTFTHARPKTNKRVVVIKGEKMTAEDVR